MRTFFLALALTTAPLSRLLTSEGPAQAEKNQRGSGRLGAPRRESKINEYSHFSVIYFGTRLPARIFF